MKKIIILLASIVAICSCDKAIDPSLVNVEIELSCIDEEPLSYANSSTKHTFLCTGKIGGFTGTANVEISSWSPFIHGNKSVSVAGESTSFSFTFTDSASNEYNNEPITFDVTVTGPDNKKLFSSSVVVYL